MRAFMFGTILAGLITGCTKSGPPDPTTPIPVAESETKTTDGEFNIGDPAPKFDGLVGTDDKQHSLDEFASAKAVAVVFTCNSCPVAQAYEDRLVELQKDYADKNVQLVAINVNNLEEDKLPAMKTRAEENGFQFPYLYDPTQQVARDYGATVTPHVFLLDAQRKLAYVGPVDDSQDQAQVKRNYLREAIDAVLGGGKPETAEVEPFGCSIKYE